MINKIVINRNCLITILVATCFAAASKTHAEISRQTIRWTNPDCLAHPDCELREASITVVSDIDADSANTSSATSFTTSSLASVGGYAIVQYIRGCAYSMKADGTSKQMGTRTNLGETVLFQHRHWQLDTGKTKDPIYQSDQPGGYFDPVRQQVLPRTGAYFVANPLEAKSVANWGGFIYNLVAPRLYVADAPQGSAIESSQRVDISSLEFKTCLYRASDIPLVVSDADSAFANPLHCFAWQSNYRYLPASSGRANFHFVASKTIDPFCKMIN
jgi:hypothetical protein